MCCLKILLVFLEDLGFCVAELRTVCPFCGFGCAIYIDKETGAISGGSCVKGFSLKNFMKEGRIFTPLARVGRRLSEASWTTVILSIASELKKIVKVYGGDSIAFLGCSKCTNEENYLLQKLARLIGSNNIDNSVRLCHAPSFKVLSDRLGFGAQTNPFDDLLHSRAILILGYNPVVSHPPLASILLQARNKGAKLIVVDIRESETAKMANTFVRLWSPGLDYMFLNCLAKAVVLQGLHNREFVEKRTEGFEEFLNSLEHYTPSTCEEVLKIPWSTVIRVAESFASAGCGSILWGMGVTQHIQSVEAVEAIVNLALLLGYVGKRGCGLYPVRGQNNVQGACDMGALPDYLPGYERVEDSEARKRLEVLWNSSELPEKPGLTAIEILEAASRGKIRALFIIGENPLRSHPNEEFVRKALRNTELVVISDARFSETSSYADFLIAVATWAEKEGSYTNSERKVRWSFKVFDPPGKAVPDWLFLIMLGNAIGLKGWRRYDSPDDILREVNATVAIYRGITPERLKNSEKGLTWPCYDVCGDDVLYTEGFATASGRARFSKVSKPVDNRFKGFRLATYRLGECYNTVLCLGNGADSGAFPALINKLDAAELGIADGDEILVTTPCGKMVFSARVAEDISRGIIAIPWHSEVNRIVCEAPLNDAKMPPLKSVEVLGIELLRKCSKSPQLQLL
jgi:formate dehydrogenase major subunit